MRGNSSGKPIHHLYHSFEAIDEGFEFDSSFKGYEPEGKAQVHTVPTLDDLAKDRFDRHLQIAVDFAKSEIGKIGSGGRCKRGLSQDDFDNNFLLRRALHNAEMAGVSKEEKSSFIRGVPILSDAYDRGFQRDGVAEKFTFVYAGSSKVDVFYDAVLAVRAFLSADIREKFVVFGEGIGRDEPTKEAETKAVKSGGDINYLKRVTERGASSFRIAYESIFSGYDRDARNALEHLHEKISSERVKDYTFEKK